MGELSISKIENITSLSIQEILSSTKISNAEKVDFIKRNSFEIKSVLDITPTSIEYKNMMEIRPLIKYRPLKNSFTKQGDKILLAKTLNILPNQVDDYIKNVQTSLNKLNKLDFLPPSTFDSIKTYIYRHGSAEQLVLFFDYELLKTEDKLKTLYKTLEYNSNGIADYFVRPIHRMKNSTLVDLYNVVDKHLQKALDCEQITQKQKLKISQWALKRIYLIQHNSKFVNSLKVKQYI